MSATNETPQHQDRVAVAQQPPQPLPPTLRLPRCTRCKDLFDTDYSKIQHSNHQLPVGCLSCSYCICFDCLQTEIQDKQQDQQDRKKSSSRHEKDNHTTSHQTKTIDCIECPQCGEQRIDAQYPLINRALCDVIKLAIELQKMVVQQSPSSSSSSSESPNGGNQKLSELFQVLPRSLEHALANGDAAAYQDEDSDDDDFVDPFPLTQPEPASAILPLDTEARKRNPTPEEHPHMLAAQRARHHPQQQDNMEQDPHDNMEQDQDDKMEQDQDEQFMEQDEQYMEQDEQYMEQDWRDMDSPLPSSIAARDDTPMPHSTATTEAPAAVVPGMGDGGQNSNQPPVPLDSAQAEETEIANQDENDYGNEEDHFPDNDNDSLSMASKQLGAARGTAMLQDNRDRQDVDGSHKDVDACGLTTTTPTTETTRKRTRASLKAATAAAASATSLAVAAQEEDKEDQEDEDKEVAPSRLRRRKIAAANPQQPGRNVEESTMTEHKSDEETVANLQTKVRLLQDKLRAQEEARLGQNVDAPTQLPEPTNPHSFLEMKVCKYFCVKVRVRRKIKETNRLFYGIVVSYDDDGKCWKVVYDDGDTEELGKDDLDDVLALYELHK